MIGKFVWLTGFMGIRSLLAALSAFIFSGMINSVEAQPAMVDPNLSVRTVVTGLTEPTGMAFLGPNDFLVLEKSTGKVQRVVDRSEERRVGKECRL